MLNYTGYYSAITPDLHVLAQLKLQQILVAPSKIRMDLPQCALLIVLTLSSCILLGQNQEYQPVLLNYQQIYYMGEYIVIGVKYAGTCTSLGAEAFTRADIMAQRFDSPMTFDAIDNKIAISRRSLSQNENQAMCVRLVARNGSTTCSSANFPYTFYHFSPDGTYAGISFLGYVQVLYKASHSLL